MGSNKTISKNEGETVIQNSGGVYDVVENLILLRGETLLDVGCGTGEFINEMYNKKYFKKISACGYESINFKIPFKKVDLNKQKLPYKNNSFGIVTCMELIEHIENPFNLIRELHRVCKKDGTVILTTPNVQNWYYRLYYACTGKLLGFDQKDGYSFDHITPIHWQVFKNFLEMYFEIEDITTNRAFIPIFKIPLPFKGVMFGDSLILRLRKK